MEPLIVAAAIFAAVMGFSSQPAPQLEPEISEVVHTPTTWKLKGLFRVSGCHEGFVILGRSEESIAETALEGVKEINFDQFGPAEDVCTAAVFSRKTGTTTGFAVAVVSPEYETRLHPGANYIIRTKEDDVVIAEK